MHGFGKAIQIGKEDGIVDVHLAKLTEDVVSFRLVLTEIEYDSV